MLHHAETFKVSMCSIKETRYHILKQFNASWSQTGTTALWVFASSNHPSAKLYFIFMSVQTQTQFLHESKWTFAPVVMKLSQVILK